MVEIKHKGARRLVAGLGALSIAGAGLIGTGLTASADEVGVNDIKADAPVTLTLHKHQNQTGTTKARPDGKDDPKDLNFGPAMPGVKFSAFRVKKSGENLDLTKGASWQGLDKLGLSTCDLPQPYDKGEEFQFEPTDADGVTQLKTDPNDAKMKNFLPGAYLVCETGATANVKEQSQPFLVTLPFPYEGNWLYEVSAYPKNAIQDNDFNVRQPLQTIVDYDKRSGNDLKLNTNVKLQTKVYVPRESNSGVIVPAVTKMFLQDKLPAGLVPDTAATVYEYSNTGSDADFAKLPEGLYTENWDGQTHSMDFAKGLASLKTDADKTTGDARPVIRITYTAKVVATGEHTNILNQFVNTDITSDSKAKGVLPSNPVFTSWGNLKVQKVDSGLSTKVLKGADFEVLEAEQPYPANGKCDVTAKGAAIEGTKLTTDSDGRIAIDGLFVSNSNQATRGPGFRCYVLKETQAPQGYTLPDGKDALTAVEVKIGDNKEIKVENTVASLPNLPLTGAAGTKLLIAGGAALVLLAMGLFMVRRYRANENA